MGTPLYTVEQLRRIERLAQQGLPSGELMARAGRAAARWIGELHEGRHSICVVAGPGNNGGDGFVVATELRAAGHDVHCVLVGAAQPATDDARAALGRWRSAGGEVGTDLPSDRFDVVVDALLGIGLARPLQGDFLAAAQWIDAQESAVYALDVPSGLDSDRGNWVGGVAGVRASATITFLGDKAGLHTGDGVDAAGSVTVDNLDVSAPASDGVLVDPVDFRTIIVPRRRNTHKGSYGSVLVIGGGVGMVGAPLLAARAALRIGAGRVFVDCIGDPALRVDPMQPELMFRPFATLAGLQTVVVGCGLGQDENARAALEWSLRQEASLVVDADALNLMAEDAGCRNLLLTRNAPTVLTPHPLEAARLLGSTAAAVQSDRIGAARSLAGSTRARIVLKGAGSVIADADGRYAINPTGGPALATAGTGDALAGLLGGLLAQSFDAWQATLAAVWLHGQAAIGGDVGLVASEIAPRAVAALRALRGD
jgi:hydroxyethylthiazole kinase-like uncharacterized protein yjeF